MKIILKEKDLKHQEHLSVYDHNVYYVGFNDFLFTHIKENYDEFSNSWDYELGHVKDNKFMPIGCYGGDNDLNGKIEIYLNCKEW